MTTEERLAEYDRLKVYLKIPVTTRYSGDIHYFKNAYIVEGTEFCEKDIYGDNVRCWYVSTTMGECDDKEWLLDEIVECGCIPTIEERMKKLFI